MADESVHRCPAVGCTETPAPDRLTCAKHWAYVSDALKDALREHAQSSVEWRAAADAVVAHVVRVTTKIKGYEEHGSYPSPHQARCSVCGELSWLCPHDWSLRLPQEKWEAFGTIHPWPPVAAPVAAIASDKPRDEVGTFTAPATLEAWTDGSGTKKDTIAGIGVVLVRAGEVLVETSECIGIGSNNVAEVRAIGRALTLAKLVEGTREHVLDVFTDSEFAIGALTKPWEIRANPALGALVKQMREEVRRWPRVRFHHVPGHSGVVHNERADRLAGQARRRGILMRAVQPPTVTRPASTAPTTKAAGSAR